MSRRFTKGLVSIVTPVYNGEKYIFKLINSVIAQTYGQIELIIADDGSDDNTIEVIEAFRPRLVERNFSLRLVKCEHSNAAGALSQGLKYVSGEFLIWPDGDDELTPDSIEKRVAYLNEHPEYMCVRSQQRYADFETGTKVDRQEPIGSLDTRKLFWDILDLKTYICCGCYMLRSSQFFEIYPDGGIPVYNVGQNFQMLLPYMYYYECPTIKEALYIVNRRNDSHSARILTESEERAKFLEYESMIDELAKIIGIKNRAELRRIDAWKMKRRRIIAVKYHDKRYHRLASLRLLCDEPMFFVTKLRDKYVSRMRGRYLRKQRDRLKNYNICLVSSNCIGGCILHDLGLQFASPFVNLMIGHADYIKMLKDLPGYMAADLVFIDDGRDYPVAMLRDIKIYFVHYESEDDARSKWQERTARMDYEHIYVLFTDRDGVTDSELKEFDDLPYKHKAVLVHMPSKLKSAQYIRGYRRDKEIGMLIKYKSFWSYHMKYDDFDYIKWFNA